MCANQTADVRALRAIALVQRDAWAGSRNLGDTGMLYSIQLQPHAAHPDRHTVPSHDPRTDTDDEEGAQECSHDKLHCTHLHRGRYDTAPRNLCTPPLLLPPHTDLNYQFIQPGHGKTAAEGK